jgi:hypothetical protein
LLAALAHSDLAVIDRSIDRHLDGWLFWLVLISLQSLARLIDQNLDGSSG